MKNKPVWQFVMNCLDSGVSVCLLAVVESSGSSPGREGFKMAVAANGERCGTIGGGIMEVHWVTTGIKSLQEGISTRTVRKVFHSRESQFEQSGLICSGSQTILAFTLDIANRSTVDEILTVYEQKQFGRLTIEPQSFTFESNLLNTNDCSFRYSNATDWIYQENLGVLNTVYVIGSGHVGLALSRIMATLDFHVVVVDERPAVETFVSNSFAHTKHSMPYENIGSIVSGGEREYVAVVTTAYESDERALKAIVGKNPRYIGLMGSPAKSRKIFDDLTSYGLTEKQLRQIHSPIGLPIASHTPEEIAISIAAEIIKAKNEPNT
jgi:xanthine dehydrogenase accessory factor